MTAVTVVLMMLPLLSISATPDPVKMNMMINWRKEQVMVS